MHADDVQQLYLLLLALSLCTSSNMQGLFCFGWFFCFFIIAIGWKRIIFQTIYLIHAMSLILITLLWGRYDYFQLTDLEAMSESLNNFPKCPHTFIQQTCLELLLSRYLLYSGNTLVKKMYKPLTEDRLLFDYKTLCHYVLLLPCSWNVFLFNSGYRFRSYVLCLKASNSNLFTTDIWIWWSMNF